MPEQQQVFSFEGYESSMLINLAYGTLLQLGWTPKYAGENILVAYTPRNWKKYENEITIQAGENSLSVTSKMVHGEAFDMLGKNKKNISEFIGAFEKTKSSVAEINPDWNEAIEQLKQQTVVAATEEVKQAEEVDKVMNLSKGGTLVTYIIIGINIAVFLIMVFSGVDIMSPLSSDLIKWGANIKTLTMDGEWWRLLSCVFIHIGVIHLLFNMYALYSIGIYLEPMLGRIRYIAAYLATGVFASMASLWWHKESVTSAGASGAIFGVYGVFLALLSTNLIPKQVRNGLLQSIGVFVLFNLFYGMKGGIDNSAHIGGLLSGVLIGYLFYLGLSKKINISKTTSVAVVVLFTVAAAWLFLNKYSDDTLKFNELMKAYSTEEEKALTPIRNSGSMTASGFKDELEKISLPSWDKNLEILQQIDGLNISERLKKVVANLKKYTELRRQEAEILIKAQDEPDGIFDKQQEEINKKLEELLKELNSSE